MTGTVAITPNVLAILAQAATRGPNLEIKQKLSREEYVPVAKTLELMGGKWSRTSSAFVFCGDAQDALDAALMTGEVVDRKKLFQFFETPTALAARMVEMADLQAGDEVLEPSAGHGAIIREMPDNVTIVAVELDKEKPAPPRASCVIRRDFLECSTLLIRGLEHVGEFDAVIMNPPFSGGQDVKHIQHAATFLRPGGRLVAVCANGPRQQNALKPWLAAIGGTWEDLPDGTFKASGTNVRTALIFWKNED